MSPLLGLTDGPSGMLANPAESSRAYLAAN